MDFGFGDGVVVSIIGILVVFVALMLIICMVKIVSAVIRKSEKATVDASGAKAQDLPSDPIAADAKMLGLGNDREALVAVIAAAVAETMGTDVSGIRICSIRKI